jgi:FHS family L-fucose permease-like MFS transporter
LGHPAKASTRLNLASAFNALGAVLTSLVGRSFILSGVQRTEAQLASMSESELNAFRVAEASTVKLPYIVLGLVFLVIALILFLVHIPEPKEEPTKNENQLTDTKKAGLFDYPHLVLGVLGIFFYVGAQVGVASFIFRYSEFRIEGIPEKTAALYITYHLVAFMIGRFIGTALQQKIKPNHLLALFASASLILVLIAILGAGNMGIWAVIGIGFFHSIMFPTIFALALRNLGNFTKDGSTYLVMAIVGGALLPLAMGYISDVANILVAFIVPAVCYVFIIYYALKGYQIKGEKI